MFLTAKDGEGDLVVGFALGADDYLVKPFRPRELFEQVWQEPFDTSASNTVMVHICHLRQKCAEVDASQPFIDTVWGVGYRLRGEGAR